MKIIVDENIPFGREAFSTLGDVVTTPGRGMTPELVRDADMLMIRSITKVDAALLSGSRVRFVATATIGEDHVDKDWLAANGIGFASAPGCNANSVAEYVVYALLDLAREHRLKLNKLKLGIVGVGNVGAKVAAKATALGMTCVLNDPPLARQTKDARYRPLSEIAKCDIITFHTPLTPSGQPDATWHLADEAFLASLKPGVIIINTSRGPVVDNNALLAALKSGRVKAAVLDVWEWEPLVTRELLDEVFLATPHIAGYSFDGKVNGTLQIYKAACRHLGVTADWDPTPLLPSPDCLGLLLMGAGSSIHGEALNAVRKVYDFIFDDKHMRSMLGMTYEDTAIWFDKLRKEYPIRREWTHTHISIMPANPVLWDLCVGLGFKMNKGKYEN